MLTGGNISISNEGYLLKKLRNFYEKKIVNYPESPTGFKASGESSVIPTTIYGIESKFYQKCLLNSSGKIENKSLLLKTYCHLNMITFQLEE